MKKILTAIFSLLFLTSLGCQNLNKEVIKEGKRPYLLGKINKSGLTSKNYNSWFQSNYDGYKPDSLTIQQLSSQLKEYKILGFMGTWCGDSKRQVPKLYKVLEACNFPKNQLKMIAVSYESDLYKQSPNHEEAGLNIHRVPIFIVYKNEKEINRIVEKPITSIEKDLLQIITNNNYISNYHVVDVVNKILEKRGVKGLVKESSSIVSKFNGKVKNIYELNTYSRVLLTTDRKQEALEVLHLNTQLFPENPKTYEKYIKELMQQENDERITKALSKALKKFPNNKRLKSLYSKYKSL